MPLDAEARRALTDYLLMRPDDGKPSILLGKTHNSRLADVDVLNDVWARAFPREEWGETATNRAVTSHYGRHFFTTFWVKPGVFDREEIKYMPGDTGTDEGGPPENVAIDAYIHRHYEDIAQRYTDHVFSLGL